MFSGMWLGQPTYMWLVFLSTVLALLAFDLGVLGRRRSGDDGTIGVRQSLGLSAFYIAAAAAFGMWVWVSLGPQSGMEYFTGFALEKALALDNVFIISMIFGALAIPRAYQHRVLFWGILGVLVLRAVMIGLGAALVSQFDWVMWIFAVFLAVTGVRMLLGGGSDHTPTRRVIRWCRRWGGSCRSRRSCTARNFWCRCPTPLGGYAGTPPRCWWPC
ncbi:TerC family protein [Deinococcus radiophilus]|uniref:TerC family protein n=1 Tax=Deinococcus radiophilus TaxID=32062 RepID=UPI00361BBFEC